MPWSFRASRDDLRARELGHRPTPRRRDHAGFLQATQFGVGQAEVGAQHLSRVPAQPGPRAAAPGSARAQRIAQVRDAPVRLVARARPRSRARAGAGPRTGRASRSPRRTARRPTRGCASPRACCARGSTSRSPRSTRRRSGGARSSPLKRGSSGELRALDRRAELVPHARRGDHQVRIVVRPARRARVQVQHRPLAVSRARRDGGAEARAVRDARCARSRSSLPASTARRAGPSRCAGAAYAAVIASAA